MAKTLKEMGDNLKEFIMENEQTKNGGPSVQRYNNLKLTMDTSENTPNLKVNLAISEAKFNLASGEKMTGSLGPEEKYIKRWFGKPTIMDSLNEIWKAKMHSRTKMTGGEDEGDS